MSDNTHDRPDFADGWQTARRSVVESMARARARWTRIDWLPIGLVVAAMIVGAALRLYNIGEIPSGFNQDEAVYSYDAYSLTKSGRDHLGHPLNLIGFETYGDWTPPMHSILLTPAAALFGLDIVAFRTWTVFLALALIPVMYLLAKLLFVRTWAGVTAAWIVALLPWHVAESRWVHPSAIVPTVTALLIFALVEAARERHGRWLVAAAVLAVMGLAIYPSLRAYVGFLIVAAVVSWWRWYLCIPLKTIALAGLIVCAVAIPTYAFIFLDEAGGMRMREVSVFTENSFYLPAGTEVDARFLAGQYADYFMPRFILQDAGDYYPRVLPEGVGVLPIAVVGMVLAGVVGLVVTIVRPTDRWQRSIAIFLLIALVTYPLSGAVSAPSPVAVRVIHGIPVIVLIAVFGLSWLYSWALRRLTWGSQKRKRYLMGIAGAALALLFVAQSAEQNDRYFSDFAAESASDFHHGFPEVVDYTLRNQILYDEIWIAHVNEPYIYYLFLDEMDPAQARERYTILRDPNGYNWVTEMDNLHFTARIWMPPPEDLPIAEMDIALQTFYANGDVAYEVRTGMVPNRGYVMVVYKPEWL
jgi:4-amino-4-deoxy-L-arabinose transferase-like glycosyltransferase